MPNFTDPYEVPMRGIGGAKTVVGDYLRSALPGTNAALRAQWGLDSPQPPVNLLPDPDNVFSYEQGVLDAFTLQTKATASSLVFVSGTNTLRVEQVNFSPAADPYYDVIYQLAAVCWVKTHRTAASWENLVQTRDNFTVAVRFALIYDPSVGTVDHNGGWTHLVDVNSIRETYPYPDPTLVQARGDRYMAGATVGFQIRVRESAVRPPLGTVLKVTDTVSLLHPAFL